MSYTKRNSLHDRITIDGTDVSNAFSQFGLTSDDSDVDVSGFSESGVDETLSGTRAEGFSGQAFFAPELADLLWPIHRDRSIVEVTWQPNGLIDPTEDIYFGNCQLRNFDPNNQRGSASTMPITLKVADPLGVQKATAT